MQLRRLLLLTTALSGLTLLTTLQAARAEDDYDWSGFYAGFGLKAELAQDSGELVWTDPSDNIEAWLPLASPTPIYDGGTLANFPGGLGGAAVEANAGFNVELDNFLFGLEASFSKGSQTAEKSYSQSGQYTTDTPSVSYSYSYGSSTITTTSVTTTSFPTSTSYTSTSTYDATSFSGTTTLIWETSTPTVVTDTFTVTTSSPVPWTYSVPTSSLVTSVTTSAPSVGVWDASITGRAQIDWLSLIKGRVGLTADRTLFYATGGLAIGQVTAETNGTLRRDGVVIDSYQGSTTETMLGYVVGAGVEHALDEHWLVNAEVEYFNLGEVVYSVPGSAGDVYGTQTELIDGTNAKLGIKYKF